MSGMFSISHKSFQILGLQKILEDQWIYSLLSTKISQLVQSKTKAVR